MKTPEELELEELLKQLAPDETARAQLLEEHRQLEKDLLRLADPMPPADFVQKVMAKLAVAPAPAVSRGEILVAVGIVFASVVASVLALSASGEGLGGVGLEFAQLVLRVRETVIGLGSALGAVWRTAALPLTLALGVTLACCLVAFKRFVLNDLTPAKGVS